MQWPFQGSKMRWRVSGSQAYLAGEEPLSWLPALNAPCKILYSMTMEQEQSEVL